MPKPEKKELAEVLTQLREWALIERLLVSDPAALKAWREVAEWAEGTASHHQIKLITLP